MKGSSWHSVENILYQYVDW